jgi:hypothetical protein
MKYAKNTTVTIESSQNEIQNLIKKYGATKFAIDWDSNAIIFEFHNRTIKLQIKYPNREEFEYASNKKKRSESVIENKYQMAKRQAWRILVLYLKANLEAIDSGILTMDQVFMPYFLMKTGQTLSEYVLPQLPFNSLRLLPNDLKKSNQEVIQE